MTAKFCSGTAEFCSVVIIVLFQYVKRFFGVYLAFLAKKHCKFLQCRGGGKGWNGLCFDKIFIFQFNWLVSFFEFFVKNTEIGMGLAC